MAEIFKVYRHKKSGHYVRTVSKAKLQTANPTSDLADMEVMIVYEHEGTVWVRSEREFDDGRFEGL